jgi:hypothetical protein
MPHEEQPSTFHHSERALWTTVSWNGCHGSLTQRNPRCPVELRTS